VNCAHNISIYKTQLRNLTLKYKKLIGELNKILRIYKYKSHLKKWKIEE
jgi:hypothetical protein